MKWRSRTRTSPPTWSGSDSWGPPASSFPRRRSTGRARCSTGGTSRGSGLLRECAGERCFASREEPQPWLPDFRAFASAVLGWSFSPKGYAGTEEAPIPAELEAALPDAGGILRPDFAVRATPLRAEPATAASSTSDAPAWQLVVQVCDPGGDFDRARRAGDGLEASSHARMERLLRHTGVPAGLLFNGLALRLISAPRGESSGWLDFRVADMIRTAGRPICTALRLLLNQRRLLSLPRPQRLAALLEDSRKYQNEVSERLAQQVLHALHELLRGFQAAHDLSGRKLLEQPLEDGPDDVYRALLTLVLRLVFLLYAEERDMLPQDATFLHAYSLAALHARLREDAALHPDTMDQRYGAYAQLLVLFRMVHDGARLGAMTLPRAAAPCSIPTGTAFWKAAAGAAPGRSTNGSSRPWCPTARSTGCWMKLLVLDGERISYRALDVEHIGSVYETMMGFRLETATCRAAAVRAAKKRGAPATVDIEALLREAPAARAGWIQDRTDRKLTDRVKQAVRDADTVEALHAALDPVIDRNATPDLVPAGAMVLQPSAERRRSGSHYTPRELTEPIVRTALEPIFRRLRDGESSAADPEEGVQQHGRHGPAAGGVGSAAPDRQGETAGEKVRPLRPERILDLEVCDPAMGSGAFLVEACRQLADALIEAWRAHDAVPEIPADESEIVYARRLVAQRCLYGVDRNPVAVDLAKLSLWLITLAKDHPLTFLDHALRHGDSLVGLSRTQIEGFHWKGDAPQFQAGFEVTSASTWRRSPRCATASAGPARRCPTRSGACGGATPATSWTQRACTAIWCWPRSSRRRKRRSARRCGCGLPMRSCAARRTATEAGSRSCAMPSRRSRRSTGRSSFRRSSSGTIRASTPSWATRRSRARTRWRRPTWPAIPTGSSRSTPGATATPTRWRTSSAAPSIWSAGTAPAA